jgi:hypothetical protein
VPATIFHAASIAAAGLAEAAVWLYAIRIREPALPASRPRCAAGCCCGSIPVAITRPALAKYLWLLVLVSGLALGWLEPAGS